MLTISPNEANIFIVEDNADNLFVVQLFLGDMHVRWHNARASGRQFFAWLAKSQTLFLNPGFRLHLILLDINIPYEDGYTVLQKMRQHPALLNTLIVAVTANVLPADVERARQAGFDGFIGKPLDRNRFPSQITRILAGETVWEAS